jgi:hypothetical protein
MSRLNFLTGLMLLERADFYYRLETFTHRTLNYRYNNVGELFHVSLTEQLYIQMCMLLVGV